jgi:hypothetical protein
MSLQQLGPAQARQYGLSHDPVLVVLGQERQLLGEMGDALFVGSFAVSVGYVGAPVASFWSIGIEQTLDVAYRSLATTQREKLEPVERVAA